MARVSRQQPQATADSNGAATFIFQPPAPGRYLQGSLCIPTAPATATFACQIGSPAVGFPWGGWAGNATFGPVQAFENEVIVVTATGLTAGALYQCTFIGFEDAHTDATPIIYPSAIATSLASAGNALTWFGGIIQNTVDQSIASGADNKINYAFIVANSGGYSGSSAFVVPAGKAGTHLLVCQWSWTVGAAAAAGSIIEFYPTVNGSSTPNGDLLMRGEELSPNQLQMRTVSGILVLAAGDTVELRCRNTTANTITVMGTAANIRCRASLTYLGA